jgi:hypothetical protein
MADAGAWLTAFWLAVVCRERERMTRLCEIPLDRLRSPDGRYDDYVYQWIDTLQTYWLRRPGLVEKLTATLRASDPAIARNVPRDMLQGLLHPPINLFHHFVCKDEEGFSPALVEALKLHKAYWTLTEDRSTGHRRGRRTWPSGDRLPGVRRATPDRRRIRVPAQAPPDARLAGRVPDMSRMPTPRRGVMASRGAEQARGTAVPQGACVPGEARHRYAPLSEEPHDDESAPARRSGA